MTTLLKKLSVKGVCGAPCASVGEEKRMMIIMGYTKSKETKATTFGDSTAFHGDFKAVNIETGEEFRSGTCYLPDVAESLLSNAMDGGNGMVEFGFEIGIIGVAGRTDKELGKYEYRCKPLMQSSENDPLILLETRIKQGLLVAPEKAAKSGKGTK